MSNAGQAAPRVRRSPWLRGLAAALRVWPPLPRPPSLREVWDAAFRWAWQHRYELLAVAVITGVGAFLRLYRLDSIAAGLHGDEALSALRADAILRREWAGPVDPFHGNAAPAGFEFWMAGFIGLFGNSVFVIRLSMAVLAIAALPLAYLLFRAVDGKATAIIGSSLLALSGWHLVFSRQAWPPVTVTTVELLAALVLVLTLRYRKPWLFPIAGAVLALGLYMYSGYPYFLVGVAVLLAGWLVSQRAALGFALVGLTRLAAAFFLVALPMLNYVRVHQDSYLGYPRSQSIFNSARYEEASGLLGRVDVILDSGRDFVRLMVFDGARDIPMLAMATSILLGLGVLYATRRWREPGIALALILLFVIPWAAILNPAGDSILVRRSIGVTPFIALLAALPLSAALRSRYLAAPPLRALVLVAAAAAIVSVGVTNTNFYFRGYANSPETSLGLNLSIKRASEYLDDLPGDPYVYFYSRNWNFGFVIRQYLAPDVEAEDRSGFWGSELDLTLDRGPDVVYVFLDRFVELSEEVQRLYPGGRAFESIYDDGTVLFRAYEREVSASERDQARRQHLEKVQQALGEYAEQEGAYPDTGGEVQTLCLHGADAACAVRFFLPASRLPSDPLGSSADHGYWYLSDGSSFVLIARQEEMTGEGGRCPQPEDRFPGGETRYCVQGALP